MKYLEDFLRKHLPAPSLGDALEKFRILREELKKRNEIMNLTAVSDDEGIEIRHFMDSLSALDVGVKGSDSLMDIGSGGGFPALPLKIVLSQLRLAVVEATLKKAAFIEDAVRALGLDGVKVYGSRSEELPETLLGSFDWVCARALAKPPAAVELMLPWAKVGGYCLLYAASSVKPDDIAAVCDALGGETSSVMDYKLPRWASAPSQEEVVRKIIVVKKTRATPPGYPRRAGLAAKVPIV